jgi:hypothetical protein
MRISIKIKLLLDVQSIIRINKFVEGMEED